MAVDAKIRELALWMACRLERQAKALREIAARLEHRAPKSKEERS